MVCEHKHAAHFLLFLHWDHWFEFLFCFACSSLHLEESQQKEEHFCQSASNINIKWQKLYQSSLRVFVGPTGEISVLKIQKILKAIIHIFIYLNFFFVCFFGRATWHAEFLRAGIKLMPPEQEGQSLNQWTTRDILLIHILFLSYSFSHIKKKNQTLRVIYVSWTNS